MVWTGACHSASFGLPIDAKWQAGLERNLAVNEALPLSSRPSRPAASQAKPVRPPGNPDKLPAVACPDTHAAEGRSPQNL